MQYRAKVKNLIEILILKTNKQTTESVIQSLNNPLNKTRKPIIDVVIKTTEYLPLNVSLKERIYHILHDLFERPKCNVCKINFPKFVDTTLGYRQFCSSKCSNQVVGKKLGQYSKEHSQELLEKRTSTNLKKYGVKNVSSIPEVNQFKSNAWKRKSKEEIQEITKNRQETLLENFGVTIPCKNDEIKEKSRQTNLERYGVTTFLNTESCRQKTVESIKNNIIEILEKRKITNLERYGTEHSFQAEAVKEKSKKTLIDRLGVDNAAKSKTIQQKIINTNIKKFGTERPLQNLEVQQKMIDTLKEKYNVINSSQIKSVKEEKQRKFFEILISSDRLKNHYIPNFDVKTYSDCFGYYEWKCLKCNTVFEYCISNGRIPRCPTCYPVTQSSLSEHTIIEMCKKHFDVVYERSRNLIPPYEVDVFIPELRLGIEFNGLYWHSELGGNKDREYHQNKLLLALQNNIQLIQIFEDEFRDKQDIVESIILNKFGKNQTRIFARKCQIYSVYPDDAKQFYFDNHMQGFINGQHLGLYYNNEIVSLITFGSPRFEINHETEIYRFCNKINTSVIGSLSKLIKALVSVTNTKSIVTYADARYGLGLGYHTCGFKFINTSPPGYFYMKHYNNRLSRNQFQKHTLKDKLKDFDPTLTEWENMQMNGYDRIWDCGVFVYELKL